LFAGAILVSASTAVIFSSGFSASSSTVDSATPNNYVVFEGHNTAPANQTMSVLGSQAADLSTEVTEKKTAQTNFYKDLGGKIEAAKKRLAKINKLVSFLKRQGSPVASYHYAELFVDLSEANGADYRIVVAISGVESGFCAANYKKYNCFGYLNGVQYGSFDQAFRRLVPKVASEYAKVYGTNFEGLAKAYGMINWELHSQRLRNYYNGLS
jgi:hypothetical protein